MTLAYEQWKSHPFSPMCGAMQTESAALMPIPGHIDPVPVPRQTVAREDGRIDLVGLSKTELREALLAAGMDAKQAKLRAKQI